MNKKAQIFKEVDTGYKDGSVQCACGWRKDMGDGFNQFHITTCPKCDSSIRIHTQGTLVTGGRDGYKRETGLFRYFVLDNNLYVMFDAPSRRTDEVYTREDHDWRARRVRLKMEDAVTRMVDNLIEQAKLHDVDLSGITAKNFNEFLDNAFGDSGEVRCEQFGDLAHPYASQFGKIESFGWDMAFHLCLDAALAELEKRFPAKTTEEVK